MEARARGGTGSDDDTVECAFTRKAPRSRKSMSTIFVQCRRLVGCLSLGFDRGRQVVKPESFLGSSGAEIDILEINDASIV